MITINTDILSSKLKEVFINNTTDIKYQSASKQKRVLVIAPHPDDEILGCGGTLCKHVDEGDLVHIVYLTNGEKGGLTDEETTSRQRTEEAKKVVAKLGAANYYFMNLGDSNININNVTIKFLRSIINKNEIDLIYVPHINDSHLDHFTANIILANTLAHWVDKNIAVCAYEIWTPLKANMLVNISNYMYQKKTLLDIYESQLAQLDFWKLSKGLSEYRSLTTVRVDGKYIKAVINERKKRNSRGLKSVFPWSHVEAFTIYSLEEYCKSVFQEFPDLRLG